jgi:hypothetical protein
MTQHSDEFPNNPNPSDPIDADSGTTQVSAKPFTFSVLGTIVCSILVVLFIANLLWSPATRLDALERPEDDLERIVGRELDMRQALQHAPSWERKLDEFLSGGEDVLLQSIRWYDDLAREVESPESQLYRVILLAEAGRADRVSAVVMPWQYQGDLMARMLEWVSAAYLGTPPDRERGEQYLSEIREELPPGWFTDTLAARLAAAIGDHALENETQAALRNRGQTLLARRRVLVLAEAFAMVIAVILLVRLSKAPAGIVIGDAPLPPPWSFEDGYALFIRGVLAFLVFSGVMSYVISSVPALSAVVTLVAGTPLLWLATRYLNARGLTIAGVFGFRLRDLGRFAQVTVVLVGISIVGELIIAVAIAWFHIHTDWTDGLLEELLWGSRWILFSGGLDSVVWAPFVEEIAFRGVLYGTLRTKMKPALATFLTAGTFAIVHGYGVVGLASVFWSGIVWAAAYERTRSLWPAIVAHAINNLLVTTEFVWLYR